MVYEGDGELGVDGGGIGVAGGGGFVDFLVGALTAVAAGEGDCGERALDGGVGGADRAGEGVQVGAEVGAEVGPRDEEVRLRAIPVLGHDVVQSEEGAGRGRAVVVPDMGVVGIGAKARDAFGDQTEFRGRGQVCFGGIDRGSSFAGLIRDGCDDPGIVTGGIKKAVKLTNVGGAETIVVVHDDVQGDGAEGEEGKKGGQDVGGWKAHCGGKQMLQLCSTRPHRLDE